MDIKKTHGVEAITQVEKIINKCMYFKPIMNNFIQKQSRIEYFKDTGAKLILQSMASV